VTNPMTEELFREDATLVECEASVVAVGVEGVILDRTVFYPLGGGQAGDAGADDGDTQGGAGVVHGAGEAGFEPASRPAASMASSMSSFECMGLG